MEIIHVLYKNNKLCFTEVMDQESHKSVDKALNFFHIYDFDKDQQ